MVRVSGAVVAVLVLALSGAARAQGAERTDEHMGLSRGLPVTIDDADRIEAGKAGLKVRSGYERQRGGEHLVTLDPEVEIGIRRGLSLGLSPRYRMGNAGEGGRGAVEFDLEYNVLELSGLRPGITLVPSVSVPFGPGRESVQSEIELRLTQPLGESRTAPRLHLNVAWRHLHDADRDERTNRYFAVAGINVAVAATTALAFDVVREPARQRGKADNFVEAGVRHALGETMVLTAGAGAGFGSDSPRFRLLAGVQKSF